MLHECEVTSEAGEPPTAVFELKRTVSWCVRIKPRWTARGHEEGRHYGGGYGSLVARDPHHPAVLEECGTSGVDVWGAGGIVPHVKRDRTRLHDDQHGARMEVPPGMPSGCHVDVHDDRSEAHTSDLQSR